MSPMVFRTAEEATADIELAGVGVLHAGGLGGIPVEEAAAAGMSELQQYGEGGAPVLDDANHPVPLAGAQLTAAAHKFADDRGLVVADLKKGEIAKLPQARGAAPEHPVSARDASIAEHERVYGHLQPAADGTEATMSPPTGNEPTGPGTGGDGGAHAPATGATSTGAGAAATGAASAGGGGS